jgi:hypothetical protein
MRPALTALAILAFLSAIMAAKYSVNATRNRKKVNPNDEMLKPGARPDETAGDALTYALKAHGRIDALVQDADDAARLTQKAVNL